MQADPRFDRDYQLVHFLGTSPVRMRGWVWVLEQSDRIGIREKPGRDGIVVPAYLFMDLPGPLAGLNDRGKLGLRLEAGERARFEGARLEPGSWQARVVAEGEARISILQGGPRSAAGGRTQPATRLHLAGDSPVAVGLELTAGREGAHVREVVLERTPADP